MRTIIALVIATSGMTALADQTFVALDAGSTLTALNNNGQAAGSMPDANGEACSIFFDGSIHVISRYGTAFDINDNGVILYECVYSSYYYNEGTHTSTYICSNPVTDTDLHTSRINNNGMMIGQHTISVQIRDAWGFTCTTSNTSIVDLPNHSQWISNGPRTGSYANSLNDAGIVVGSCTWWPGDSVEYQNVACYWTGTTIHKLGTLGYSASTAFAINTNGDIAGALYNTGVTRGFLYSGGTMHELSNFTEAPVAMNDSGVILGAKTFYRNGVVENLVDLMPAGWSNINAKDINNSNQVCGYATGPDGLTHGFILTVPEPATLSLLVLGGIALLRRRK